MNGDMDDITHLEAKASAFLENRKNANNLVDIVTALEEKKDNFKKWILLLETVFAEVLKRREMYDDETSIPTSTEAVYRTWLREIYENTFTKFIIILEEGKSASQTQALHTMMTLLTLEGQYPLGKKTYEGYPFPSYRLQQIMVSLLSSTKSMKSQIKKFAEFTNNKDVVYFAWKLLSNYIMEIKKPNEVFIQNVLELIDKIVPSKDANAEMVLCASDGPQLRKKAGDISKWIDKTWRCVMEWDHTSITHRQLMVLLLEKILTHLKEPMYLLDYLMSTLRMDGAVSVLGLQGMLTLIQKCNLNYPNIYGRIYTMIKPDIFQMKYKPRLFHLTDTFLTSSHLPQQLVAAFIKRMARLTLIAPPQDIRIMLAFIGNLLIRHPGLKKLLVGSASDPEIASDPYDMNETEPTKSRAMDSFLWEIYNLQRHYLPSIANMATLLITTPLPAVEWNLGQFLEATQDDLFDKELKKKTKEITVTYDKPQSLQLPQGEKLMQYWTLT